MKTKVSFGMLAALFLGAAAVGQDTPVELYTKGSDLRIRSLKVRKLRSACPPASR